MPTSDEWMRRLLEDSVSDVEPRDGLERIRSKTLTAKRPRRTWPWAAGTAVVATAATVAAVAALSNGPGTTGSADHGFAASGAASSSGSKAAPMRTPEPTTAGSEHNGTALAQPTAGGPSTEPTGTPVATVAETVYFLGRTPHGMRLYQETHSVDASDPALLAVQSAVEGSAADPNYFSPWPSGTGVQRVDASGSAITIALQSSGTSLADRPSGTSRETARVAVQQLVYTAQDALDSKAPVRFTVDGRPASRLLGLDVAGGVKRAPDIDVEALVWVLSPVQGAKVHSPFTVRGLANSFEANVVWELKQHGHVVKQGNTTAHQAFLMSPYSFRVHAPAGHYTLVVHDSDASGRGRVTEDTKAITVLP